MHFIGVDLSWNVKPRPLRTALAVLDEEKRLVHLRSVTTDAQLMRIIESYRHGGCLVGLDAPLVVPNERGSRPCERELQRRRCPLYAANRTWLTRKFGGLRGERLVKKLERMTPPVRLVDALRPQVPYHAVMEIYPHASYTMLFGYTHAALYKRGVVRERTAAMLDLACKIFTTLGIEIGPGHECSGKLTSEIETLSIILSDAMSRRRKQSPYFPSQSAPGKKRTTLTDLDRASDWLDAIIAAYTLWQYWTYGDIRSEVVGTLHEGYILIPSPPSRQRRFF